MMAINNPVAAHIIRIFIGCTFIVSAIFKMVSIDAFEVYLFSLQIAGLQFATILARLVITVEFVLGVFLIGNIRFRQTYNLTILILIVFSIFLIIQLLKGSGENCYCFGEIIQLGPVESLIKNIVLIGLLFLIRKDSGFNLKYAKSIQLFVMVFAFVFPIFYSPPYFIISWPQMSETSLNIAAKRMQNSEVIQTTNAGEGKKIICMLSVTCSYCVHAANKISIIAENQQLEDKMVYVFTGDPKDLPEFWENSRSQKFPYVFLPMREFFSIAGPSIPSLYLAENGEFKQQFNYKNIDENTIKAFFQE